VPYAAAWAARYEALRTHVLQATTALTHEGLIVLLRQGVAAWMMRAQSLSIPRAGTGGRTPRARAPRLPDEINASFVQVMATMALTGRYQEVHA